MDACSRTHGKQFIYLFALLAHEGPSMVNFISLA